MAGPPKEVKPRCQLWASMSRKGTEETVAPEGRRVAGIFEGGVEAGEEGWHCCFCLLGMVGYLPTQLVGDSQAIFCSCGVCA